MLVGIPGDVQIFLRGSNGWETGGKSVREIGELFGGLDYAAVAQRIRRTSPLSIQLLHGG